MTEQYPQGLGPKVPDLGAQGLQAVSKTCFSMVPSLLDRCPQLREMNLLVALDRMRQSGVFLSTSEILILQLIKNAAHPQFKENQKIIKEPVPDIRLLSFFQGKNNPLLLNSRP